MSTLQELRKYKTSVDYDSDLEILNKFFLFFTENDFPKYISQLQETTKHKQLYGTDHKKELTIELDDLNNFDSSGLIERFEQNAMTYLNLLYNVIDGNLPEGNGDILYFHRAERLKEKHPNVKITEVLPAALLRNYFLKLKLRNNFYAKSIRQIKSADIGRVVKFRGIITKISITKPYIRVSTYICDACGSETYVETADDVVDFLDECPSEKCKYRKTKGNLSLQTRGSKFTKFQQVKIQELTSDTPFGCIPTSLNLECYDNLCDILRPGDACEISGIFMARPLKKMFTGLLREAYVYVTDVHKGQIVESTEFDFCEFSPQADFDLLKTNKLCFNPDFLVKSFAPEIFGMEDTKKLILLLLLGSPSIKTNDNMFVRGTINVLLVGDPGIAKSVLLKTAVILADGIYTTGHGTSGAGLTANITRDNLTRELILEAGALVLADKTVCAIDEMDKMSDYDRTAIHEVMEQHTVSISKAGITTSLNARTSILAAANPIGALNPKVSLSKNLNFPVSLLSRFDAILLLKDEPNEEKDRNLAKHICNFNEKHEETLSYEVLKSFIGNARKLRPKISEELGKEMTNLYVQARQENDTLTPRYLLSLIRLAYANARLRFSLEVTMKDVNEAHRLISITQTTLKRRGVLKQQEIYNAIYSMSKDGKVNINDVFEITRGRFEKKDIESVIKEFENAGIWELTNDELEFITH
ncbi:DNA replication licensing factor MCM7 [Cucumispora dikerogammari]|nr:DNA replication licensing factor MCM7 [Cucumispora dikerogammari]